MKTEPYAANHSGCAIEALGTDDFSEFVTYLNDHLADNGGEAGYFQPLPQRASSMPPERARAFRDGLDIAVGSRGWRRAWVARSPRGRIIGHIDLRSHADGLTSHRCLLGIGVDRGSRRAGLGAALIGHARHWAAEEARLAWIDLQVISENRAALALYRRAGFITAGEIADMYRIDGNSFSYTTMSLRLDVHA
ncbi:GNAT family N-acetyltransferase [Massilia eurypsychrophila]|uniref:GNAT family N-acetyltransferase n=1 Tax=Massilia eurypsychrophila TaxID=1485217 RepID=UPI001E2DE7A8|nr:N-acetyltransferase [Massilia eurypsychrophila]